MAVEVQAVDTELVRKLIEEARKREPESKYILELSEYSRQGGAFTDYQRFKIIVGDAEVVERACWDAGYPYRKGCDYFIIPKTVPTVVEVEKYDGTVDPEQYELGYWIFTAKGWVYVRIK